MKNEDALKIIRDFVEQQNAEGIELDRDISVISQGEEFTYRYKNYELETLILNMLGEHQKENAALAITALIELNESGLVELDFNKMINGIEAVKWTGRIEKVKDEPLMIIDGAHNLESVEALITTLKDYYKLDNVDVLYAAINGKPIHAMVDQLKTIASTMYITDFDFPKACTKEEIYDEIRFEQKETVDDFVRFIENYEGQGLVITGSLYFISEVKAKVNF